MKRQSVILALTLMLGTGLFYTEAVPVRAAETVGQEDVKQQSGDITHSLDEETFSELIDFIKEKWDAGELKSEEDIREAIKEGEEEFAFDLSTDAENMIVSLLKKVSGLDIDSDLIAEKARELYETYGDALIENAESVITEEVKEMGMAVGGSLKEQLVEPAKEAAAETARSVAKNFWSDLKNSVVNFVKNIFHI